MTRSTTTIFAWHPRPHQAGFTLIEILVALVVLAIGLLGLAMLQTTGLRFNLNSYARTQASALAYDIIDRMRTNSQSFIDGDYEVPDNSAASAISSSGDYSCNGTGPGCPCEETGSAFTGSSCAGATLAKSDLGQWYYRLDMLVPGVKDAAQLSPTSYRATIHKTAANTVDVTIYWVEHDRNASGTATPVVTSQTWTAQVYLNTGT